MCRSLILVLPVYLTLEDWQRSEQYIAQLTDLSATHSLKPLRAIATGLRGRWLLLQGNIRDGVPLLKRASEELEAQRHEMLNMDFVSDLGAGLAALGQHEEALTLVMNALDVQKRGGKFLFVPALLRVKGLILASRSAEDYPEAERSLLSSIEWARRQSANLFELKSAIDLAELLLSQKRMPEAYRHISAALDQTSRWNRLPGSRSRATNPQPVPIRHQGRSARAAPSTGEPFAAIAYKSSQSPASPLPGRGACCDTNGHSRAGCHAVITRHGQHHSTIIAA